MTTANSVGGKGARSRLWKWESQRFSDRTCFEIPVFHFPPGTGKWNKIENRLFSFITQNLWGKLLVSVVVIMNLIGRTRTQAGLRLPAELDRGKYPGGLQSVIRSWPGIS